MHKIAIIHKLDSGKYRLYSSKKDTKGKRKNLGTYDSLEAAKKHEREVQYFKHKDDNADDGTDKATKSLGKMSDMAAFLEEAGFIDAADKVYKAMAAIDGSFEDDLIDNSMLIPDSQRNLEGGGGIMPGSAGGGAPGLFAIDEAAKVASKLADIAGRLDKMGLYDEADDIDQILQDLVPEELTDAELDRMSMDYEDEEAEKAYRKHETVTSPEDLEKMLLERKLKEKGIMFDTGDPDDWDTWNAKGTDELEKSITYVPGYDSPTGKPSGSRQADPGEAWYQGLEGENLDEINDGEVVDAVEKMLARKKLNHTNEEPEQQDEDALVQSNGRVGTEVTDNQNSGMFQGLSDAYFYSGYGNLGPQYK